MKSVFITGCSSGFGRAFAGRFQAEGWRVLAGVRRLSDAEDLERALPGCMGVLIDVTSADSIAAAVELVRGAVSGDGLHCLINNAGIAVAGPLELLTPADWRQQLEVNVIGAAEVSRQFLPLLRAGRPASIIMVGSIAGRLAFPLMGAYCASKHALAALSDALGAELACDGVRVSLIEPGSFRSAIWDKAADFERQLRVRCGDEAVRRYGALLEAAGAEVGRLRNEAPDPAPVVERVLRIAQGRCRGARGLIGRHALPVSLVSRFPASWRAWLLRNAVARLQSNR